MTETTRRPGEGLTLMGRAPTGPVDLSDVAVLLEANDIAGTSGLVPGALERALTP